MGRVKWTDEKIARLRELREQGASVARASVALKQASSSIRAKARELGIPFKQAYEGRRLQREKEEVARKEAGLPPSS